MVNKKGIVMARLVRIIIPLLVLLIIGAVLLTKYGPVAAQVTDLVDSGDCDNDRVANMFDDCPCMSTLSNPDEELRGCPKGTSIEKSEWDKKTCSWFVNILDENNPIEKIETCKEENSNCQEEGEGYLTRCGDIKQKVKAVSDDVKEGEIEVNSDLTILSFPMVSTNNLKVRKTPTVQSPVSISIDLNNQEEFATVKYYLQIQNLGPEEIFEKFRTRLYVCDRNKNNCEDIKFYEDEFFSKSYPAYFKDGFSVGFYRYDDDYLKIGHEGDYCDGPGERVCYLKVVVDADNLLEETNEFNNEMWIRVTIENQKFEQGSFESFKSIRIRAPEDTSGSREVDLCGGYWVEDIDNLGGYAEGVTKICAPGDACDGDYHRPDSSGWTNSGCWVVIAEEESRNDCGETLANIGFFLDIDDPKSIDWSREAGYYSFPKEPDPKELLDNSHVWYAPPEGSLLCSDTGSNGDTGDDDDETSDNWERCDSSHDGKMVQLGDGSLFLCRDKHWEPRGK